MLLAAMSAKSKYGHLFLAERDPFWRGDIAFMVRRHWLPFFHRRSHPPVGIVVAPARRALIEHPVASAGWHLGHRERAMRSEEIVARCPLAVAGFRDDRHAIAPRVLDARFRR
jgi:hypothetical protein